jgi:hypothetical protein
VTEFWHGNGAQRNDLATRNPEGPLGPEAHTDLLCAVFAFTIISYNTHQIQNIFLFDVNDECLLNLS